MKLTAMKSCVVTAIMAVSTTLFAQTNKSDTTQNFRTFSVEVNGGMLTHWTPFNRTTNGDYRTPRQTAGFGFNVKKQILNDFGLQADFLFGKVKGDNLNVVYVEGAGPSNSGYETNINFAGSLSAYLTIPNLNFNRKNTIFVPYLTAGAGYMSFSTVVRNAPLAKSESGKTSFYLPLGVGFKVRASDNIRIDIGYTVYSVRTNNFDGFKSGLDDHFSYLHGGLEYVFGKKSKRRLENYSPLAELHDQTLAENAVVKKELQSEISVVEQKRVADQIQYAKDLGDDDNDGVANKLDKCPGTPTTVKVDGAGCPLPIMAEKVVITEQDRKVIGDAIKNLEFEYGKAVIKTQSYEVLNRVADLLMKKDFALKLAGHTDNKGTMAANLKLSKARAEAVKAYLVGRGANASRIEATGYGYTQPIATNKTSKGRQQNRRVEFTLF